MRHPLKDISHHLKLMLAELRHTAERTIASDHGLTGSAHQFSQLEERLMMSASPVAVVAAPDAADVTRPDVSVDEILDQVFQSDAPVNTQSGQSPLTPGVGDTAEDSSTSQANRELVIIDATILNPDEWIAGLRQDLGTDFDVLVLSSDADGFSEIADVLNGGTVYSAVHVVSHGTDGQISLGQSTLDLQSLQQNQSVLESWRSGLSADADVLIYGCELAESKDGQQLVDSLAALWEADVAASDDLTGHQSLNGDWELEYQSGVIEASIAFTDAFTEAWVGVLTVNAAPVNDIPNGQTVLQDRILSFNDANGNAISVSDSDAGANDLQVTVAADVGTFAITDIGTAEYLTGDGFEDSTIVLQGTSTELNAAFQNLHFTANDGFVGAVEITITTDDLGNGGTTDSATDSDIISVFVHEEFVAGEGTVANTATDELNRNANRGVARSLAAAANGNLISVWRTSTDNAFFAIYDNSNTLVASGQINDVGVSAADVAVASGTDGDFVVAWSQDGVVDQDVFAQRYTAAGVAVGNRITVDASVGDQQAVTIDRNAAGDFVIAWENTSDGIHLRRFTADGTAIDVGVLSPPTGAGGQNASVGIDRDLNVLLGWNDGSGQYLQRFDGTSWGTRHILSTDTDAGGSSIGITENGRAVIAWHFRQGDWQTKYQIVDSDGSLVGSPRVAASVPSGDELNPTVAIDEAGNFVIAWETNADIQARRFAADGTALGSDITIASTGQFENNAAVAVLDVNNFAVMFTRQASNADVFVTRFNAAAVDTSNPVIDVAERTVGTVNSTITQTFLVGDEVSDPSSLNFGFTSSNTALIGLGDISVIGTGLYRELSINPTSDLIGSSDITVTVTDGDGNQSQETIAVFVASPFLYVTTTDDELDGSVTSILDLLANPGGNGISLREAITAANNTPNSGRRDRIGFDIAGGGQHTLTFTSELPAITEAVFVDGSTQPGYVSSPLIGLDGTLVTGNGLTIEADDVVVRGLAIFGFHQLGIDLNTGNGILLRDADDATISANYLGLDQSGSGVGNDRDGLRIIGQSNDNVIGGETSDFKNVISGNNANGISIVGDAGLPASGNQIQSNFVGVGSDGVTDVGNSFVGVNLSNASATEIIENVISGNSDSGIELSGGLTTGTVIQGNFIGVALDGDTAVGNDSDGIALYTSVGDGPSGTEIGGILSGEANVIANNSLIGVRLDSGGGIGNSIRGNQIFNNLGGLGIDLLGVNGNDNDDTDGGTNGQQNYPDITSVVLDGSDLIVQGSLNSNPNTVFDIDIYASVNPDANGFGEAEVFVGTFSVTTDGFGDATFNETLSGVGLSTGMSVTATATNSDGSTSEFSENEVVVLPVATNSPPTVSLTNVVTNLDENSNTSGGIKIADIVITDDGEGTNSLSLAGANASEFIIVGSELRLQSGVVLDFENATSLSVEVRVNDVALVGSPEDSVATTIAINNVAEMIARETILFSSVTDVTSADPGTGLPAWQTEDVVALSNPDLSLGAGTTQGDFSIPFSIQAFVQDGEALISGLHVVGRDITVGTSTSVALQAGDILLSTATSETFNGGSLTTSRNDIVLFRPDTQFDYSSGTFSILIDGMDEMDEMDGMGGGGGTLAAFTFVEQTTTIGDTSVDAGDFLFVRLRLFESNDIVLFEVGDVGEGSTTGTATQLLEGRDFGLVDLFGFSGLITSLELIENTTTIGGVTLDSGTILFSSTISPDGISTNNNDVIALNVTETEIGSGTTTASASLFLRGDDLGLTQISSLSLGNQPSQENQPSQMTSLSAVADNTLSVDNDNTNFGSSTSLVVDKGGSGLGDERAIVRFDLSSLPPGAVITSAYLRLQATSVSGDVSIQARELTEAWDESTSTYDDRTSGTDWTTEGGTVDSAVLDTVNVDSVGAFQWDITSLVAAWQDGSSANNGVLLGSTASGNENVVFGSRESATPPELIIEYTNGENSSPVVDSGGPYTINEGDTLDLDASGTTDPDGETLTYNWDLDNDGSFDDATGVGPSVAWADLPTSIQDDGTYTIRVSVSDGTNPAEIAATTLTVNNVAPTGNSDSGVGFTTAANRVLTTNSAVANDTDPAGSNDPIEITSIDTTGTLGQVTIGSGNQVFEYDPNGQFDSLRAGESVTDTFRYSITDGDGGTDSDILVTITIQGVNDTPTAIQLNNLTLVENSDGAVVGDLSTTDLDTSDSHTYSVDDGRFEVAGNSLRLRAGQSVDFEAEPTISIDVTSEDLGGLQLTRTFTLSVTDANDVAPVIVSGQVFGISELATNGTVVGGVLGTDGDSGTTFTNWTIVSGNDAGHFQIDAATGQLTVAPGASLDFESESTFTLSVTVSDGVNTSGVETVEVSLTDANDNAPVLSTGIQFSVSETALPSTVVGTATATDADSVGSFTNWMIVSGNDAGHFQIDAGTGQLTVAPGASLDFESESTFTLGLTVSDGVNTSTVETVEVLLTDANDNAPVIDAGQEFNVLETAAAGTSLGILVGSDADAGDALVNWTIVSGNDAGNFVLDANTGELRLANGHSLNHDTDSTFLLGVTASDGVNTSVLETVLIEVIDVDIPPSISAIPDQVILEDSAPTTVSFDLLDVDTAAADLVVTAVSSNDGLIPTSSLTLSGTAASRQLSFASVANQSAGSSTIVLTVSDGVSSFSESFEVTVSAVNDAPVIAPTATQTVDEDQSVAVSVSVSDIDSPLSALTVSATSSDLGLVAASGLQFSGSADAPVLRITPEMDQFGTLQITVTVSDGLASSSTSFVLNVDPVNDAPTVPSSTLELAVNERLLSIFDETLLLGTDDFDSSILQPVLTAGPLNGRLVEIRPGEYVYTPDIGFSGQDQFTYVVTDGLLTSSSRVVSLDVVAVVPSPVVINSLGSKPGTNPPRETSRDSSSDLPSINDSESESNPSASTGAADSIAVPVARPEETTGGTKNETGQDDDAVQMHLGNIEGLLDNGFVFQKVVNIDEAGSRSVGSVSLRDDSSQLAQQGGRRGLATDQFLAVGKFNQSDWQYYSDLKSTVGGVQVFRENLQDEFAFSDLTTGTITLASTGAAVGFVVTAVRSGMLALGFLSQLPVWTLFDPLMVVDGVTGEDTDEDSIQDIVDRQSVVDDPVESDKVLS